jgi:asparagine synthase (glutamine-hydrolysing)
MCGIMAAFGDATVIETAVRRGTERMRRRGPDAESMWQEPGVCLGHRRLAVIDLDARAAQPMVSPCGRYVIVLNGEIYNYRSLRDELERGGVVFRTTSDTEVVVALFAAEGQAMLPRLLGMFAFVIWDRQARRGFAARDPYGIKPLYCASTATGAMMASQVKALLATGCVSREPNLRGQAGFWLLGSVPEPQTWYRDITALPSGHFVWIDHGACAPPVCWSDIGRMWREAPDARLSESETQAVVQKAVRESVDRHLVADVPVGVFLSGGIDSGALAGLMAERSHGVEGVTLTYDEFSGTDQDEAPLASAVAAHYGIRHHVRRVTPTEFSDDLPRILDAMDQPSIDGINTWYASKAAAERGLKVVVSGVGGDELFQGYESFESLPRMVARWQRASRVPGVTALAGWAGRLQARRTGNGRWRHVAEWAGTIGGAWWLRRSLYAPEDLAGLMGADEAQETLRDFEASDWVGIMSGVLAGDARLALGQIESTTYLRNQLLRDSDWASMDHSVELRTPLVDAHLLASIQPVLRAFARFPGKRMLANAPRPPLSRDVTERPKTGFGIPVSRWLGPSSRRRAVAQDSRSWAIRVAEAYTTSGVR